MVIMETSQQVESTVSSNQTLSLFNYKNSLMKTAIANIPTDNKTTPFYKNVNVAIHNSDCIDFLKNLPSESVDLIVTDPAYSGMNNKLNFGNGRIVGNYQKADNDKWFLEFKDNTSNFLSFLFECYRVLRNNRHIYIMFDSYSLLSLGSLMREVFNVKNIIIWDKVNIGMGHYFRRRHELIMFATKGSRKLNARNFPDIWSEKRIHRGVYPTQKPVEIFDRMIQASSEKGFVICDPFVGSGSSIVSSLKNGCTFIGSDLSKKACEISSERAKYFIKTGEDAYQ
ncbi:MAG: site-specific DNA-methyltransferase [Actinobacteria bacterium]|nr:MAG: site-specific DNA-methyltransferase [Actinomycetota bacterium]